MSDITQEKLDRLIDDALHICQKYERVSPPLFQRLMEIDHDTAMLVFQELCDMYLLLIVETEDEGEERNYIAEVLRERLSKFMKN